MTDARIVTLETLATAEASLAEAKDHGQLCPVWTQRKWPAKKRTGACDCWVGPESRNRAAAILAALPPAPGTCYECSLYTGTDEVPPPHEHPDLILAALSPAPALDAERLRKIEEAARAFVGVYLGTVQLATAMTETEWIRFHGAMEDLRAALGEER